MQQMNSASRTSNCFLNDSENRAPSNGQKKMVELEIPPRPFKTTSGPKKKPKLSLDSRLSNPKFTRTSSPTKSENDEKKSKLLKSLPEWVEEWKRGEVGTSYRHSRVIRFIREEFDNDYEAFLAEFGDKTLTFVDEWARDKFEENNQEWEAEAKQRQPALWYKLKANFPDLSWYRFKTKFMAEEKRLAVQ